MDILSMAAILPSLTSWSSTAAEGISTDALTRLSLPLPVRHWVNRIPTMASKVRPLDGAFLQQRKVRSSIFSFADDREPGAPSHRPTAPADLGSTVRIHLTTRFATNHSVAGCPYRQSEVEPLGSRGPAIGRTLITCAGSRLSGPHARASLGLVKKSLMPAPCVPRTRALPRRLAPPAIVTDHAALESFKGDAGRT